MSMEENRLNMNRVLWLDVAKVLTMILVIIGHAAYYQIITNYGYIDKLPKGIATAGGGISLVYNILSRIQGFIYSFHMPFFFAISGMTMALSIGSNNNIYSFISKKTHRLIIPFLTVAIFLLIPIKYISGYWDHSENMLSDIFLGQILLMGDSHLWFIVSLFGISVCFYLIHRLKLDRGIVYWGIIIVLSLVGKRLESCHLPLTIDSMMKYYLFFALGFSCFEIIYSFKLSTLKTILSWSMMALTYLELYRLKSNISPFLNDLIYYIFAIWGSANMVASAKLLIKIPIIINSRLFNSLNRHSYELYLYSEPFNYLLIFIFSLWMGYGYVTDSILSIVAYLLRIIIPIGLAYLVIWVISIPRELGNIVKKTI